MERVTIKQSRKAGGDHVTQREPHSKTARMGKGKAAGEGRSDCGQCSEVAGVVTQAGLVSILPISLDVADEIANEFDLIGIVVRNLYACKCIFDQYHQLEAIVTVHPEFAEVRFIRKLFGLNT